MSGLDITTLSYNQRAFRSLSERMNPEAFGALRAGLRKGVYEHISSETDELELDDMDPAKRVRHMEGAITSRGVSQDELDHALNAGMLAIDDSLSYAETTALVIGWLGLE